MKTPPSPLANLDSLVVSKNYLSGLGSHVKTGLYTNISTTNSIVTPYLEDQGFKFFDLPLNTFHNNITKTNLTFSDIEAHSTLQSIEENPEDYLYYAPPLWVAFSLKISNPCILKKLQLFVQESNQTPQSPPWIIELYNATRELKLELNIEPDEYTGFNVTQQVNGTSAAHWHDFAFPDIQLNMSNTYIDAKGFAYYFFKITMPTQTTDSRYLYYSHDEEWIDDEWVFLEYYGLYLLDIDICMRVELAPVSNNLTPSDILLSIKNENLNFLNLAIETNYSIPVQTLDAVSLLSGKFRIPSQNFTLTEYGTVYNISLYMKYLGGNNTFILKIFPSNYTGVGPLWDGDQIKDGTEVYNIPNGFEGWYTFQMRELPNLKPGQYWWTLFFQADTGSNLTLYGSNDPPDKAIALNITLTSIFDTKILNNNFANIIGIQNGLEFYNVSESWITDEKFYPDAFDYHHFTIVTRWGGLTRFNVTSCIELENIRFIQSTYYSSFQSEAVLWNLTVQTNFMMIGLGKIIKLTIPSNWYILNITINGKDHGDRNWTIYPQNTYQIISINNASTGLWTIFCNSSIYPVDYEVAKLIGGKFETALNATVYDRLQVNITIVNQTNGICHLTIFYPDLKTIFTTQVGIINEAATFLWYPENDSAATGGNYTLIAHWSNGTVLGYNQWNFFFTPIPTNISIISSISSPYVDDITQSLIVRYFDTRGVNITGAHLSAKLNGISLNWEDIYSKSSNIQDQGLYRINLNTTGLNANQNYQLNISIQKIGYMKVSIAPQEIWVAPVPTSLISNVNSTTQYQNEFISFSCSFKDTFHKSGIDWASISYNIIGTKISGTMSKIMPGESIYIAANVLLENLTGRAMPYIINITASALNCQTKNINITLFVLNKTGTMLYIIKPTGLVFQGQRIQIEARLQNQTDPYLGIPNATIRFSFGGIIPDEVASTDANGIARVEISIPKGTFSITAFFDEASSISASSSEPLSIDVFTYSDLALWIGIFAAISVVSILVIRQFYVVPKRNQKLARFQKIVNKFRDASNIRQILILLKESGVCIFHQSFGTAIDGDLISGFLSAISSFQEELKPEKTPQKEPEIGGFELHYQTYRILLFEGTYIRLAFVIDETPTPEFRNLAQSVIKDYEDTYQRFLLDWHGDVDPFNTSAQFFGKKLELDLLWPHELNKLDLSKKYSDLEVSLINIAEIFMRTQGKNYVFLPMIISVAQAGTSKPELELIATIYKLRYRNIFIPFHPSSLDS